jgi:hypothetical protein
MIMPLCSQDRGGKLMLGPIWDYDEAFGACCGYPIEGRRIGSLCIAHTSIRSAWLKQAPVHSSYINAPLPLPSTAGFKRQGVSRGASGGSAISPEGWRFNICAERQRCIVDPVDGISLWWGLGGSPEPSTLSYLL